MSPRCPHCGTSFADGARFCTRDGTALTIDAPRSVRPPNAPATTRRGAPGQSARRKSASSTKRGQGRGAPAGGATEASPAARGAAAGRASGAPLAAAPGEVAQPQAHATLAGCTIDDLYRIDRKLGEGGMSFVYLATDLTTGESRAVKVLSPSLSRDQNAVARLGREAELAGRVRHPNVCHIERFGQTADGLVYVVMPYLDGEILADRTYRLRQLSLDDVVAYVTDIAAGLQAAHDHKIVHRDLKPENVMIARGAQGKEYAVVMDFGLAKERRAGPELEKLTASGIVLGTPEFMSPEQLRGKPLDGRSDVYALALMTVEMLTGTLPFTGKTQQELMLARLRNEPTPLRRLRPDLALPASVERVLLKGLVRNPDERYATAPEFAAALQAASRPGTLGNTAQVLKKWFG
jgi:eukaryotic-like serine/threonine-protein kinase